MILFFGVVTALPLIFLLFTTINITTIMITYEVRMNDGDNMGSYDTLEEAREKRSDINHRYISRWANIYQICFSRVTGFYSSKKIC